MRSAALLASSSILALMFSAACSAVMNVHSDRAGQAAKGSLRSTSANPCCLTALGALAFRCCAVSILRRRFDRGERHARSATVALGSAWPWLPPTPHGQHPYPHFLPRHERGLSTVGVGSAFLPGT